MAVDRAASGRTADRLTGAIGDDVHARTTVRTSQVNWLGLTAWGAGTGGQLVMHPGGI